MKFRAPNFSSTSVMIADSNMFTLKLLRDLCRECGMHRVVEAQSALDLTAAVAAHSVDIYVIDQTLLDETEASGWTLIDARVGADGVAPVIVMFGLPTEQHVARARKHGVKLGLCKPFSPKEFWARMQWLVGRASPSPALSQAQRRSTQPSFTSATLSV
jgi:DNA-binding response OmpR family regulator